MESVVINHWILDYLVQQLYSEYAKHGTIDQSANRDLLQGMLLTADVSSSSTVRLKSQILVMLCYLVDGNNCMTKYEETDAPENDVTVLENLLAHVVDLALDFGEHLSKLEEFIEVTRTQAVYVCCREGEFELAQEVFNRLRKDAQSSSEQNLMKKLQSVITSNNKKHHYMAKSPFSDLKDAAVTMLDPIMQQLKKPFLVAAAKKILEEKSVNAATIKALSGGGKKEFYLTDTQEKKSRKHVQELKCNKERYKQQLMDILYDSEHSETNLEVGKRCSNGEKGLQEHQSPTKTAGSTCLQRSRDGERQKESPLEDVQRDSPDVRRSTNVQRDSSDEQDSPNVRRDSPVVRRDFRNVQRDSPDVRRGSPAVQRASQDDHRDSPKTQRNSQSLSNLSSAGEFQDTSPHGIRAHKLRRGEKRKNRHQVDTDSSDSELEEGLKDRLATGSLRTPTKRMSLAPSRNVPPARRRHRKNWSQKEERTFYQYMVKYGPGSWATIASCTGMEQRSNVDLKDKWRNMISTSRRQQFEAYVKEYGPVKGFEL